MQHVMPPPDKAVCDKFLGGCRALQLVLSAEIFNLPPVEVLKNMTLQEWKTRTNTFVVLVPLTDRADVWLYLARFECGIHIDNKGTHRSGNGCKVH
jgi:hypothetical protein